MSDIKEESETEQELSLDVHLTLFILILEIIWFCRLHSAISAVLMEIKWWKEDNLVGHYKDEQLTMTKDFMDRVSLLARGLDNGNVLLTLRNVRLSQSGLYICEVSHEGKTMKKHIFLSVISEQFSLVTKGNISADHGEDVLLPVHLSPETSAVSMTIRWSKGTELIYEYKNGKEKINNDYESRVSLSKKQLLSGNVSLTLKNVQLSDSGQYTCRVFHDGCLQTATVHFQVVGPTRRRRNSTEAIRPVLDHIRTLEKQLTEQQKILKKVLRIVSPEDTNTDEVNTVIGGQPTTEGDTEIGADQQTLEMTQERNESFPV